MPDINTNYSAAYSYFCSNKNPLKGECVETETALSSMNISEASRLFGCPPGKTMDKVLFQMIDSLCCEIKTDPRYAEKTLYLEVVSGYRSPDKNAAVGGVKQSRHMEGKAADIRIYYRENGRAIYVKPATVFKHAEKLIKQQGFGGAGLYSDKNQFVHIDSGERNPGMQAQHYASWRQS